MWRPARGDPQSGGAESGETLIEILITISLMGVAFAAVMGALFTASASAALNREKTEVSVFLQAWAEVVLAPTTPTGSAINYAECGRPLTGPPRMSTGSWSETSSGSNTWKNSDGWTATQTIRYAEPGPTPGQLDWNDPSWSSSCPPGGDTGLQEITLSVTTDVGDRQVIDNLVVYKRDPRCPSDFDNADKGPC